MDLNQFTEKAREALSAAQAGAPPLVTVTPQGSDYLISADLSALNDLLKETGASYDPTSSWLYVTANKLPWVVNISRAPLLPKRQAPFTAGNTTYLQYCSYCHGPERDGAGMAPSLFTLPGRMRDAGVLRIIHNGRGSMPSVPVPDDKLPELLDFLAVELSYHDVAWILVPFGSLSGCLKT